MFTELWLGSNSRSWYCWLYYQLCKDLQIFWSEQLRSGKPIQNGCGDWHANRMQVNLQQTGHVIDKEIAILGTAKNGQTNYKISTYPSSYMYKTFTVLTESSKLDLQPTPSQNKTKNVSNTASWWWHGRVIHRHYGWEVPPADLWSFLMLGTASQV